MERLNKTIPDDLKLNILSKFPMKSLKRFRCVQKSWAGLFKDSHFMRMYYENLISKNDYSCLLLKQQMPSTREVNLFLLSGERYENKVKLDWPPPFQESREGISIFGPCINGTICLYQGSTISSNISMKVVFWNPTTEEFKVIPPCLPAVPGLRFSIAINGFGYDRVTDDYKLIQNVIGFEERIEPPEECPDVPEPFWQIYSLKSNSWRKLDLEVTSFVLEPVGSGIYFNGACHWWGIKEHNQQTEVETLLVSFDMSNEMFHTTPIDRHNCYEFIYRQLVVFNGFIALISNLERNNCFDISILGEVGVKESWVKLFTIGPIPCVEQPIGVRNKGNLLFRKNNDELAWFDLSTQMIEETGIKGELYCCQIVIYMESFLSIGGINFFQFMAQSFILET